MWRALLAALILVSCGACADQPLRIKKAKQPEWLPFAIEGIVAARAWVPEHQEVAQDHDGKLLTRTIPEQFFVYVATPVGSFRLIVSPAGYSWAYEGKTVLVVGVVSNEENPKLVVGGLRTVKKPHENYKAAAT